MLGIIPATVKASQFSFVFYKRRQNVTLAWKTSFLEAEWLYCHITVGWRRRCLWPKGFGFHSTNKFWLIFMAIYCHSSSYTDNLPGFSRKEKVVAGAVRFTLELCDGHVGTGRVMNGATHQIASAFICTAWPKVMQLHSFEVTNQERWSLWSSTKKRLSYVLYYKKFAVDSTRASLRLYST